MLWQPDCRGWPPWLRPSSWPSPPERLAAIPSFRLSGVYLAVATFGFGLLLQNLIYPTFLMFGQADFVSVPRPHLFGINATSDRAYYYVALVVAALCAGVVIGLRRSRLGRLLRGMSDSPLALEAHGANTRLTRLYVFGVAAGIAAVGGVLIAGVTQSAGGTADGPFGYFNSVVLLAVLAICGSQPILSPVIAAFLFEVVKIYRPFNDRVVRQLRGRVLRPRRARGGGGTGHAPRLRRTSHRDPRRPQSGRQSRPPGAAHVGPRFDRRDPIMIEVQPDLEVDDLTVQFGGLVAVNDVSRFAPAAGAITGLIGPNGAGKTTIFNACTGVVSSHAGPIRLGPHDLGHLSTAARASHGLGRTFQRMELFDSMTVAENVALGPEAFLAARRPWSQLACSRHQRRDIGDSVQGGPSSDAGSRQWRASGSVTSRPASAGSSSWPGPWRRRSTSSCSTSRPRDST